MSLPVYKSIILPIALAALAYISALLNWPLTFIVCFALTFYSPIIIGWLVCCKAMKINTRKPLFVLIVVIGCLLLFIFGRRAINRYYMPHSLSEIRVACKIILLIATVILFWLLVKRSKKTMPIVCSVLYLLFIVIAPFVAMTKGPSAIKEDNAEKSLIEVLRTLPYVGWAPVKNTEDVSVTVYDPDLAFNGYNLYGARDPYMYLIDMEGNLLHTWRSDLKDDLVVLGQMLDNGDLLTFTIDKRFMKLDWDSNVLWENNLRAHHDFYVAENGDIYTLARKDSVVFYKGMPFPILEDFIAVLSPEGRLLKTFNIYKSVEDEYSLREIVPIYKKILKPKNLIQLISRKITGDHLFKRDRFLDIMHTNTVELLNRDIPGVGDKGGILLSIREIDLIGVLDTDKNQLVWKWGPGHISKQHRPTVLDNNNILLFDNGRNKGFSRILEIDPADKKIVWNYNSDGSKDFYTSKSGSCQQLPNNNILISQSHAGRVFELTRDGKVVWEYYNPHVNEETSKREVIYVMERLALPEKVLEKIQ